MVELKIDVPDSFYEEEERCEYLISSEMKKVWAVQMDLANELLRVCNKYKIKVFASDGTLLGAIRHKGFIPWDDDMDFTVFRSDYEKLCKIAEKEFEHPYFWQTEFTDPGCLRGHAQLRNSSTTGILNIERDKKKGCRFNQGIFIDIWVLDTVIDDEELLKKQEKEAEKYKKIAKKLSRFSHRYVIPDNKVKRMIKKIIYPVTNFVISSLKLEEYYFRKYENVCKRYNYMKDGEVSIIEFSFDFDIITKKEKKFYNEVIMVPFEFMELPVMKDYDSVLRCEYNNYMEFVKGYNSHGEVFFDTNKSYKEYLQ